MLIVGAGPTGLALAIELGQRSIPCLLIERNDRVGYAARAKTTNVRTREHLRRWGIADKLKAASPLGLDYPSHVVFCTRMGGHLLTRFENAFSCGPGRNPLYSEHAQWIPQYSLEEVMRAHAQTLPSVGIRFLCEFVSMVQDDDGVHATLRDLTTKTETVIDTAYLVGTDGARSGVRAAIGARMEGEYGLSRNYNVVFHAPGLAKSHRLGPAVMYWQVNGDVPSLIGPMDQGDKWFFMPTQLSKDRTIAHAEVPALIQQSTGIDTPIHVLSSDEWVASRLIADRYRDRRVFLAGDACHLHPPFGGYGMNMGVADGVDLGWKLAAVLQGWGGNGLLGTYEHERRQVHNFVMDEAVANHKLLGNQLWQPGLDDETPAGASMRAELGPRIQLAKMREFNTLGVVLGARYDHSPIIVGDGTPASPHDFVNYVPTARPGALAPHAWLHDGTSLYDHFGMGFTLIAMPDAQHDEIARARSAANAVGLPLKVIEPAAPAMKDLYRANFALVRPDQHVAWRGDTLPDRPERLFAQIAGG